jgi:ribose transport system ATP-binding protein
MTHICKSFGGVKALQNVDFDLCKGEIHALVGENGAGKSTLMKILYGIKQKDSGSIFMRATDDQLQEVDIPDPVTAQRMGISMVFQELNLLKNMTIAENIFLGREPVKRISRTVNDKVLNTQTAAALKRIGLNLAPDVPVGKLSCGQRQCVEIAKALSFGAKVIIFDEPTASLTNRESEILFKIIENLKIEGVTVVYISHRMDEIFRLADRITVFRNGIFIKTLDKNETTIDEIVKLMIGHEIIKSNSRQRKKYEPEVVLSVEKIQSYD